MDPVLIIGAGLSGLTLARALQKNGIPFLIFDRDSSPSSRSQGWSLGLGWAVTPMLSSISNPEGLETCAVDYALDGHVRTILGEELGTGLFNCVTGECIGNRSVPSNRSKFDFRVNRLKLREWLREGINVNWSKRFRSFVEDENGVTVTFEDGVSVRGSLLIGADGVTSPVRQALFSNQSPTEPQMTVSCLPIKVLAQGRPYPFPIYQRLSKLSTQVTFGYSEYLLYFLSLYDVKTSADEKEHRETTASYLYLMSVLDHDEWEKQKKGESDGIAWFEETRRLSQDQRRALANYWARDMCENFKGLVDGSFGSEVENYPVEVVGLREVKIKSIPVGKVSLVGDAAHAMSFFHGAGANHGILDSCNLSRVLAPILISSTPTHSEICTALQTYAVEMLHRTTTEQSGSRSSTFEMHKRLEIWASLEKEEALQLGGRTKRVNWAQESGW